MGVLAEMGGAWPIGGPLETALRARLRADPGSGYPGVWVEGFCRLRDAQGNRTLAGHSKAPQGESPWGAV